MTFESPLILESGKIFMESAILGFGIRNSALGIWNLTDDWNTESQFHWQRVEPSACIASLRASVWKKMKGRVITGSNSLPLPFRTRVKQQASTVKLLRNHLSFYNDIQGLEEKLLMHGNKIFPVCPNRNLTANVLLFVCFCFVLFCSVLFCF